MEVQRGMKQYKVKKEPSRESERKNKKEKEKPVAYTGWQ